MKLVRLIWKNTTRNPRRTVLTISSIMVSIFLVSTLQAIVDNLEQLGKGSGSSHLRLIVHRATSMTQPLPVAYKQRIAALPGVKYVGSGNWFGGLYIDERNFFANFATDVDDFDKINDEYQIPPEELAAWKQERSAALVGRKLMEKYGWKSGDHVTLKGTIYPVDLEFIIRAVYTAPNESDERAFFFHWDYFDESLGRRGQAGSFSVKVNAAEDVPRVMDAIDRMFRNTDAETKTETEQAFNLSFVSMLGNIKLLLTAISAAVVFTILLVAGNTMAMSIRERTGEVGVLKTLGFRRNTILLLLVGESLAIASLGGVLGGVGAKLAYAFIHATSTKGKVFGLIYASGVACFAGYGLWMLFAGSVPVRGAVKATRYVATLIGVLVGFGAGFGFYLAVGFIMNQGGFLSDFHITGGALGLSFAIAISVGILSAVFPALRAARMSIAEALHHVG